MPLKRFEFIEVVRNFEVVRKKWLYVELELKRYKELLVQSDVARAALEVKLKHARNQVDVEIKKRCRVEADYQYLVTHMVTPTCAPDPNTHADPVNGQTRTCRPQHAPADPNTLSVIDESSFLSHSDISYDRTEDDLVCTDWQDLLLQRALFEIKPCSFVLGFFLYHPPPPPQVIRPETCVPCGKRIRFGKVVVKCRDCRVIAHPECKHLCLERCSPIAHGTPHPNEVPSYSHSQGVYRVPGGERQVKELRERYVSGRGPLMLHKVDEVHVVCGLLKDFLRKLKEPLVTFKLHRSFMEAAESTDDDRGVAELKRAVTELPRANRDTLAFLVLHLQRVMNSPPCQMDQNNLARVFGPTIVGHAMPEPSPLTIMKDTNTQPKVCAPVNYGLKAQQPISCCSERHCCPCLLVLSDRIFKPVTSPELSKYPSKYPNTPGSASLKGKIKNLECHLHKEGCWKNVTFIKKCCSISESNPETNQGKSSSLPQSDASEAYACVRACVHVCACVCVCVCARAPILGGFHEHRL
uniref:Si:ch1073-416j23.1 n=1 Tax=Electrophorus electricus TaxID=8005 RepID=A0A4W4EV28_ELEEL